MVEARRANVYEEAEIMPKRNFGYPRTNMGYWEQLVFRPAPSFVRGCELLGAFRITRYRDHGETGHLSES